MNYSSLFELRGFVQERDKKILSIIGTMGVIFIWQLIVTIFNINEATLPSPIKVMYSFKELHFEDALIRNALYSLKLNLLGMTYAVLFALPLGFLIGLFPIFKHLTEKQIAVFRYLPLTLLIGVFIHAFGFYDMMKMSFLAVGIFVYLLPTVVLRVSEVDEVYVQTVKTLGASKWQTIKTIFVPGVLSKTFDDIIVLAPISWTYIIIAEMMNNTGGLGALAYLAGRQSRADKAFAILVTVFIIGMILDKGFSYLDKIFFKFKYVKKGD